MNHFSQQLNMSHISQCKPLGPVVYETLATSLDPYPKSAGASFQWSQDGPEEHENGPFAGLKRLKDS